MNDEKEEMDTETDFYFTVTSIGFIGIIVFVLMKLDHYFNISEKLIVVLDWLYNVGSFEYVVLTFFCFLFLYGAWNLRRGM